MGINAPQGVSAFGNPASGDQANSVVSGQLTAVGPGLSFPFSGPYNLSVWGSVSSALTTTAGSTSASVVSGTGIAAGCSVNSTNVPAGTTWATFSGTSGTLAFPTLQTTANTSTLTTAISGIDIPTAQLVGATVSGPGIPAGTTVVAVVTPWSSGSNAVPDTLGTVQLSAAPTASANGVVLSFALSATSVTTGTDANASFTGSGTTYSATWFLMRSFDGGKSWVNATLPNTAGTLVSMSSGAPFSQVINEPERGVLQRIVVTAYTSGTINYRMSATGGAAMSVGLGSSI